MDMKEFPISHFNGFRDTDELVIYTGRGKTQTNSYGVEAVVVNSRVMIYGSNNHDIPENGYVVSGHGKAAEFIKSNVCDGAKIEINTDTMILSVEIDSIAKAIGCEKMFSEIESRNRDRINEGCSFDRPRVAELLAKMRKAIDSEDYDELDRNYEQAYYLTSESKKDEIRAVWHRPHEHSDDEVNETVLRLKNGGFNQILIETDYEGYSNALKLKHDYLPVRKGYENGFDVIEAFIQAGKKYGVKIHAWFEDFFYGVKGCGCPMAELHPEWMARRKDGGMLHDAYDDFYFLNPVIPEVRTLLLNHIRELLDNYDFDGFQLDYIRYPVMHGIDRCAGFDDYTKTAFLRDTGIGLDNISGENSEEWILFTKWRAQFVSDYVNEVSRLVREYSLKGREIKLSTAVFGDPEEAIRLKAQDWRRWVTEGLLDAIYPMAYLPDAKDVGKEVHNMVSNYGQAPNISGISPMYSHLPAIESTKQVEECRKAGAVGVAFFCSDNCTDEQLENLKKGVFRIE